ncbi:hypothetical protein KCP78_12505 [Salmonella enterica subsp. enterica]|nr:hypothetical protein KCP78_12505 [Salmonella enterica subsp. enterica]
MPVCRHGARGTRIAAGVYPNPVPHAHVFVTTTTHKTSRVRGAPIRRRAAMKSCIN